MIQKVRKKGLAGAVAALVVIGGAVAAYSLSTGQSGPEIAVDDAAAALAAAGEFEALRAAEDAAPDESNGMIFWSEGSEAREVQFGDVKATIEPVAVGGSTSARLTLTDGQGRTFQVQDEGNLAIEAVSLDRAVAAKQIFVRYDSGGSMCCLTEFLLTPTATGWKRMNLSGAWDPSVSEIIDIDGDGRAEITRVDPMVQYGFSDMNEGVFMPRIEIIENGRIEDRTTNAAYRDFYVGLYGDYRQSCADNKTWQACAAYAAVASLIGKLDEAMPLVLQAEGKGSARLPFACRGGKACVDDNKKVRAFGNYRDALDFVLKSGGYKA
ncbi:hypothetical protein [uncultured Brevundimonas sp.]|uniref:hypothetical protein n=1 Tax=uncultured Brevundimonas sp. TaxID=213418 RepID=UPI00260FEDB5|nr:hypothetical protein [uncultured Brevundimonas sp.]